MDMIPRPAHCKVQCFYFDLCPALCAGHRIPTPKPIRRYCQGCEAYYPVNFRHQHGEKVCQLDADGTCEWVKELIC